MKSALSPKLFLGLIVSSLMLTNCGIKKLEESGRPEVIQSAPAVPLCFELKDCKLEMYADEPCSIVFKQIGKNEREKKIAAAMNGRAIYLKPVGAENNSGPDAIVEWSLKDGSLESWILSMHPTAHVTNFIATGSEHLKVDKVLKNGTFRVRVDDVFDDLGGAHQVIVPMSMVWDNTKFRLVEHESHGLVSRKEILQKAKEFKTLTGSPALTMSPELSEAVLCLCNEGDAADGKKLLDYSLTCDRKKKAEYWKMLQTSLRNRMQKWKKVADNGEVL